MNVMDDKENCLNTRPASFLETVDDACSGSSPNRFMCSFEVNPTEETNDSDVFLEPSPRRRSHRLLKRISSVTSFDTSILSRKRKRKDVDDNVSVQSFNTTSDSDRHAAADEKKTKRSHGMKKMSSLVSMLSPANNRVGRALERSFSFKAPQSPDLGSSRHQVAPVRQITPYKKPKPACADRRNSRFWSETVDQKTRLSISSHEIKRQEAIFELVQGEQEVIEDLTMVHKLYHNSMKKLGLLTDSELDSIFGIVERLVPCHQDLLKKLQALRCSDGTTDVIGTTILDWVPNLKQYETYCANQVFAKGLLDYKKNDPKVDDFLTRCQESSFSRKLDLWNFLDLPRSRLVKYPLLIKQICKQTDDDHPDKLTLQTAMSEIEDIIKVVDARMGESKCQYVVQKLEFSYDSQISDLITQSTSVLCSGQLKNDRGTKLHVFLFDKVLVITRQATRSNMLKYQVVKDPIPLSQLELTDLSEVDCHHGSFKKRVLRQTTTDKCAFRVTNTSKSGHSHVLCTKEEHDKRQWVSSIQKATLESQDLKPIRARSRSSKSSLSIQSGDSSGGYSLSDTSLDSDVINTAGLETDV